MTATPDMREQILAVCAVFAAELPDDIGWPVLRCLLPHSDLGARRHLWYGPRDGQAISRAVAYDRDMAREHLWVSR